jgi:hypothetical protein
MRKTREFASLFGIGYTSRIGNATHYRVCESGMKIKMIFIFCF